VQAGRGNKLCKRWRHRPWQRGISSCGLEQPFGDAVRLPAMPTCQPCQQDEVQCMPACMQVHSIQPHFVCVCQPGAACECAAPSPLCQTAPPWLAAQARRVSLLQRMIADAHLAVPRHQTAGGVVPSCAGAPLPQHCRCTAAALPAQQACVFAKPCACGAPLCAAFASLPALGDATGVLPCPLLAQLLTAIQTAWVNIVSVLGTVEGSQKTLTLLDKHRQRGTGRRCCRRR
jgi:hypothetical protein